jgi:hypothetical protein
MASCGAPVRDRSVQILTATYTLLGIASVFVILRFAHNFAVNEIGLDDWFVLGTLLVAIPSTVIIIHGSAPNGLGKDIWTLRPDQITNVMRYFYIVACLYYIQATLVKLMFITFYIRIFGVSKVRRLLWGTFIGISIWGFAFLLTAIFQCRPISYFWTHWDGSDRGGGKSCIDPNLLSWVQSSMSIALDVWVILIPLWQLRKLNMHWKKKIFVAFMFLVGAL